MASVPYRYYLARSSDMKLLGELQATSRNLSVQLNMAGSATFGASMLDSVATQIYPVSTCIVIYRNKSAIWSGPVWTMSSDASSLMMTVTAVGWLEILRYRMLRVEKIYTAQDAAAIISDLLAIVNAQTDSLANVRSTGITMGTTAVSQNRTRSYTVGQKVGDAIAELCSVESGVDVDINPLTRALSVYARKGSDKPGVRFGFKTWPNNLTNIVETFDTQNTANRVNVQGKQDTKFVDDPSAITALGQMFEELITVSDVADSAILSAYAGAEVIYRATPPVHYEFTPVPYVPGGIGYVPQPFVDYVVGDTVRVSAKRGRIQLTSQAVRIFGMNVSIDDQGNETVSSLQTTASA